MTDRTASRIQRRMLGAAVEIESDSEAFARFAEASLAAYREASSINPDLLGGLRLSVRLLLRERVESAAAFDGAEQLGRNAYVRGTTYLCRSGPLAIAYDWTPEHVAITARLTQGETWLGRWRRRLDPAWVASPQDYFLFLRVLVLFPVFAALARKGIFVLHGAALNLDGRAVVLAGLQGAGKTSSVAAYSLEGPGRFLADNYVLFDEARVYPFVDWIRLDASAERLIPHLSELGAPAFRRFGRAYYHMPNRFVSEPAPIGAVLLPRLGDRTTLTPLSVPAALDRIALTTDQSGELHRHHVSGLMDLACANGTSVYAEMVRALQQLLGAAKRFDAVIDRGAPLQDSLQRIMADAR